MTLRSETYDRQIKAIMLLLGPETYDRQIKAIMLLLCPRLMAIMLLIIETLAILKKN